MITISTSYPLANKEIYINELKGLVEEDNKKNNNNYKSIKEDFYEYNFSFKKNKRTTNSPDFEICGHRWKMQLNIRHFGYFIVLLKNLDIQKDNEYILSKMVFSFRDKFNSSYFITKVSPLYCFGKTSKDDYSGYICYIYRKDCGYIQPLIDGNELIVGVYLNIYEQNNIDCYLNVGIKNLIPVRNNDYEMKEEKYYEIGIDDWRSIHEWKNPHTWSRFIMCDHKWKLDFFTNDNGFIKFKLINETEYFYENENIYLNCVFFIRNGNDFSYFKAKALNGYKIINEENRIIEYNEFMNRDDLFEKDDNINKGMLLKNNKTVCGVFIRIYEKNKPIKRVYSHKGNLLYPIPQTLNIDEFKEKDKGDLVLSLYNFEGINSDELNVKRGDYLIVTNWNVKEGWVYGHQIYNSEKKGLFPKIFITKCDKEEEYGDLATSLYNFIGNNPDELDIIKGEKLRILNWNVKDGWVYGYKCGNNHIKGLLPKPLIKMDGNK